MREFWEKTYQVGQQLNRYPDSNLVSAIMRNLEKFPKFSHALELGSGAGNNLGFLADLFELVTGVDFSPSAIEESQRRYSSEQRIRHFENDVCSLIDDLVGSSQLVVDRATLCHISPSDMHKAMRNVNIYLVRGGLFFSSGFFDVEPSLVPEAKSIQRHGTFTDIGLGEYTRMLEAYGFEILLARQAKTTNFHPPHLENYSERVVVARKVAEVTFGVG